MHYTSSTFSDSSATDFFGFEDFVSTLGHETTETQSHETNSYISNYNSD